MLSNYNGTELWRGRKLKRRELWSVLSWIEVLFFLGMTIMRVKIAMLEGVWKGWNNGLDVKEWVQAHVWQCLYPCVVVCCVLGYVSESEVPWRGHKLSCHGAVRTGQVQSLSLWGNCQGIVLTEACYLMPSGHLHCTWLCLWMLNVLLALLVCTLCCHSAANVTFRAKLPTCQAQSSPQHGVIQESTPRTCAEGSCLPSGCLLASPLIKVLQWARTCPTGCSCSVTLVPELQFAHSAKESLTWHPSPTRASTSSC